MKALVAGWLVLCGAWGCLYRACYDGGRTVISMLRLGVASTIDCMRSEQSLVTSGHGARRGHTSPPRRPG